MNQCVPLGSIAIGICLAFAATGCSDASTNSGSGGLAGSDLGQSGGAGRGAAGSNAAAGGSERSPQCESSQDPIDPTALIDNLEDNDAQLVATGQRNGLWWLSTDLSAGNITPPGDQALQPARILGGRCSSKYAMHVAGDGFSNWGAMMIVNFRYDGKLEPIDASNFHAMRFWARAGQANQSQVRVQFQDGNTSPEGGVCNPTAGSADACYNGFGVSLTSLDTEWRAYRVEFDRMSQRAFGLRRDALDTTTLYSIDFVVPPNALFDVWVDDLWFE